MKPGAAARSGGRVAVLIPAAGESRRMGEAGSKILTPLLGEAVIRHTVRCFQAHAGIDEIRLIVSPEAQQAVTAQFAEPRVWDKLGACVIGGPERWASVRNGLAALAQGTPPALVLVHDGARPCCSPGLISRVLAGLDDAAAVIPTLPIHDTVRCLGAAVDESVLERSSLVRTQTPQGFRWPVLWEAYQALGESGAGITDDAQVVERHGVAPMSVAGEERNLKLTTSKDLAWAAWLMEHPMWGASA